MFSPCETAEAQIIALPVKIILIIQLAHVLLALCKLMYTLLYTCVQDNAPVCVCRLMHHSVFVG